MVQRIRKTVISAFLAAALCMAWAGSVLAAEYVTLPENRTVTIPVSVGITRTGSRTAPASDYTLTISAEDEASAATLEGQQTQVLLEGLSESNTPLTGSFTAKYSGVGVYRYQISQSAVKTANNFTYDTDTFYVTVTVVNSETEDGVLEYVVTARRNSWDAADKSGEIAFSNSYYRTTSGGGGGNSGGGGSSSRSTGTSTGYVSGGPGDTTTELLEEEVPLSPLEVLSGMLPQTGQLNWPVPYLVAGGLLMLVFGCRLTFGKARRDA